MRNEKTGKGGKRVALIILCVVLAVILAVLLGGTLYANHLMGLLNRVDGPQETLTQEQLDNLLSDETVAPDDTTPSVDEDDIDWGSQNETIPVDEDDGIVNILLIGQDAREGQGRQRSDTMILCTLNKDKKTITLTSFLRDLYVQIPGYMDNKINASYAAGGVELLNETLNVNFGLTVDGNVEVDFGSFAKLIDLLGGVDLELRWDEAQHLNNNVGTGDWMSAGMMHLNGDQALEYARIRYLDPDADFSRTNRQRKVINALIDKFRSSNLTTLLGLLNEALPMITTDMSNSDIIGYVMEYFPMLVDCTVVSQRVPADGAYYLAMIRNMSCVVADMDAARQLIKDTVSAD